MYAQYGLAAYCAQCFEKHLINFLLLHAQATNTAVTLKELDDLEEVLHKKTLGKLLKEIGAVMSHNSSSEQLVNTALKRRNFLTHRYFWERAYEFMSSEGRVQMIAELEELRDLFERAEFFALALCQAAAKAAGIPWEFFETEFARTLKELQDQDRPADH